MKVLQLGKYYYPYVGGIESHLQQLCGELNSKVDIDVVVSSDDPRDSDEEIDGVRVHRCGEIVKVASTSICPSMVRALSERDYDIVHVHFPNPMGVMSYLAAKKPRDHRIVVTYHSDVVKQRRLLVAYQPFMNLVLAHASSIICSSPNLAASSEQIAPYRNRVDVVPFGVDLERFRATPEVLAKAAEIRREIDGPLLLGIGRLVYYKGFEHAVRALREIPRAHLVVVGDGPLRFELESVARSIGVGERVHFVGQQDDEELHAYYRACDVFVFPSIARSEAFGIVQLEAMACGKPVVNTSLDSGVPFVSRHEESGLTVRPGDPYALASAIRKLLADDEWRRMLGEQGRRRVETDFTKEKMAASVLEIYERALGKDSPGSNAHARNPFISAGSPH